HRSAEGAAEAQALREALRGPPPGQAEKAERRPEGEAAAPVRTRAAPLPSRARRARHSPPLPPKGAIPMDAETKAPAPAKVGLPGQWQAPPSTLGERLVCIEAMGERINGIIRFMCQAGSLGGTSVEVKERAVTAFYERLVVVERQLSRIQDDLRLGGPATPAAFSVTKPLKIGRTPHAEQLPGGLPPRGVGLDREPVTVPRPRRGGCGATLGPGCVVPLPGLRARLEGADHERPGDRTAGRRVHGRAARRGTGGQLRGALTEPLPRPAPPDLPNAP